VPQHLGATIHQQDASPGLTGIFWSNKQGRWT